MHVRKPQEVIDPCVVAFGQCPLRQPALDVCCAVLRSPQAKRAFRTLQRPSFFEGLPRGNPQVGVIALDVHSFALRGLVNLGVISAAEQSLRRSNFVLSVHLLPNRLHLVRERAAAKAVTVNTGNELIVELGEYLLAARPDRLSRSGTSNHARPRALAIEPAKLIDRGMVEAMDKPSKLRHRTALVC